MSRAGTMLGPYFGKAVHKEQIENRIQNDLLWEVKCVGISLFFSVALELGTESTLLYSAFEQHWYVCLWSIHISLLSCSVCLYLFPFNTLSIKNGP